MSRSPRHRLDDIVDTTQHALAELKGKTPDALEHNWLLRHGLQSAVVIVAEAAKALPPDLTATYPAIPWSEIVGMGVKIKHHYHRIAPRMLWDTVTKDFPLLLATARKMIADLDQPGLPL